MIELPQSELHGAIRGVVDAERTDSGLIPVRLPQPLAAQVTSDFTTEVFRMAGGVRLAFETEATVIELDVAVWRAVLSSSLLDELAIVFDFVVDGHLQASRRVTDVGTHRFDLGENLVEETRRTTTLRFDGLPAAAKTVELWLPQNAVVELCAVRSDLPLRPYAEQRPRWVHYGSSISHCLEAHSPTQTWPAVAARVVDVDLLNLGVAGECFLDQFAARTIRAEPAACISLKVGINVVNADAFKLRTFAPAVHGFLDTVRERHADTPILVVSPIFCPVHEDTPGPTLPRDPQGPFGASARAVPPEEEGLSLRRIRTILEELVATRRAADPNLYYLDGLTLFGEGDVADLPDLLHPNGDGYVRIGERFAAAAFGAGGAFAA